MKKKRNRIVINWDQPGAGRGKARSSRIGRVLLIVVVVLLFIVGGIVTAGYFWWRHYQSSPAYTLALLADASQRKDTATVDGILDTDKITADFVAQVRERTAGSVLNSLWSSQVESSLPSVTPKLRETVHDEIVKELQRLTEPAAGKPLFLVALVIGHFADIKQEDKTAQAQVKISDEQLRVTMQSEGERWRITAVQDDKLAKQISDDVMRDLPARGSELQEEIRKRLEKVKNGQK
jgi:uncharacterized protein YneF (UPF0154 family)